MNVVEVIRRAVTGESETPAPEPRAPREPVIHRFRRLHGIDENASLDSVAAESLQRIAQKPPLPPGRVRIVGPRNEPVIVNYSHPLEAAFDLRREGFERALADAESRLAAARDDLAADWGDVATLSKAQADVDRLREHVREMQAVACVGEFIALCVALQAERKALAALEPEPHYQPVAPTTVVRPDNVTRNPMRQPDAFDLLQAAERVRTSRLNSILAPESTPYSRSLAEVSRIENCIRQWYRKHPTLGEMIDEDRGIVS